MIRNTRRHALTGAASGPPTPAGASTAADLDGDGGDVKL